MSRTTKPGKRNRAVHRRGESEAIDCAVSSRHSYGSTEKILRRNRKTWTRLANKRRRAIGKRCSAHDTLAGAQKEIERQYKCRPPRANRKSKLKRGPARSKGRSKRNVGAGSAEARGSVRRNGRASNTARA